MKTDDVKSSCEFKCEIFALLPPFGPLWQVILRGRSNLSDTYTLGWRPVVFCCIKMRKVTPLFKNLRYQVSYHSGGHVGDECDAAGGQGADDPACTISLCILFVFAVIVLSGVARLQAQPGHTWGTLSIHPHPRH